MNEISVVVSQTPGEVSWNFQEVKERLETALSEYQGMVYTDDTIKTAKSDVANLRALAKTIEDRRKEVKEKCLEPYSIIEKQAKELVALIDKPIAAINEQVQNYENRRKQRVRAEIDAYWKQKCAELPEAIWDKAHAKIYDSRWENATATKKSWKDGIDKGVAEILGDIETIKSFDSEFEEDMFQVFYAELSLQSAIKRMNELKLQKERILEIERKKQEEAARKAEEQQRAATIPPAQPTEKVEQAHTPVNTEVKHENIPLAEKTPEMVQEKAPERAYPGGQFTTLRIVGTPQQIAKIKDYIKFTGATWEEV